MAGENSARPTGGRARGERSEQMLFALQTWSERLIAHKLGAVIVLFGACYVFLTLLNASTAAPTIWPALIIGYGLLFVTYASLSQGIYSHSDRAPSDSYAGGWSDNASPANYNAAHPSFENGEGHIGSFSLTRENTEFVEPTQNSQLQFTSATLRNTSTPASSDWSDLMSQVSHELRTPLNAVIGFSDAMNSELLGPLDNPRYREYLAHICESGRELLKTTEDTLAMTSLLAGQNAVPSQLEAIDLRTTLREAWAFVEPAAQTKEIQFDIDDVAETAILADLRPLKQTFVNLLSAAIQVASEQTTITIQTRQTSDVVEVVVCTKANLDTRAECAPKLSALIARALLELQGTMLQTAIDDDGYWRAVTQFNCRIQPDFFDDFFAINTTDQQSIH